MADPQITVASITVRLTYKGAPVDLELTNANTVAIEQLITATLRRPDWAAPRPAGWSTKPRPQVEPFYDGDGTPCCPQHRTPLVERAWGLACSTRTPQGDPLGNAKNFCRYSWKDPRKP